MRYILLPILLLLVPQLQAQPASLPELCALEALEGQSGRILATAPRLSRLVLLEEGADSTRSFTWRVVAESGQGPERPVDVESRAGLQILVLDAARHSLVQYTRALLHQGSQKLPGELDFLGPDFLALSQGRSLVVADARTGLVGLRRPGEDWQVLLDFARVGPMKPRSMEVLGESVFLLDETPPVRVLEVGTAGGGHQSTPVPGCQALHRGEDGALLLLVQVDGPDGGCWELRSWPRAALGALERGQAAECVLGRYALPENTVQARDFLPLPGSQPPRLLVAMHGAPACVLSPLPEAAP